MDALARARVGEIEIAYESFGDPADPPALLIMGLGTQMLAWPDGFCAELAAHGLHVVRFDNRDVGLSTHLHDAPQPDLAAITRGNTDSAPYRLADMAADAAGLIDALGLESAHVVGASMGGMIAQELAIRRPEKVRSLTSIMSNTGNRQVGQATEAALRVLFAPPARTREEAIERALKGYRVIGSPGFDLDEDALRERAGLSFDRGHDPGGVARQLAAVIASPDRTPRLRKLDVPTLVIHGRGDILVQPDGGEATAAAIPGAELVIIDGMGHDMPRPLWKRITGLIAGLVERVEGAPRAA